MKKILCALLSVFFLSILFAACTPSTDAPESNLGSQNSQQSQEVQLPQDPDEDPPKSLLPESPAPNEDQVLPPVRIGEVEASASWAWNMLDKTYDESDLIAIVQVQNWIAEDTSQVMSKTYFEAEIIKTYKGTATGKIVLVQNGGSDKTQRGYPLFTYGNTLFLFLKQSENAPYENAYWIKNPVNYIVDVVEPSPGEVYFAERGPIFSGEIKTLRNAGETKTILDSVTTKLKQADAFIYENGINEPTQVFSEKDIAAQLEKFN